MPYLRNIVVKNMLLRQLALKILRLNVKNKYKIKFGNNVLITLSNKYEGHNFFDSNSSITNSFIGQATYIGSNSNIKNTKIGRFTSIGPNVNCVFGKHPAHTFVSTHPSFFSTLKQAGFTFVDTQIYEEYERPIDENNKYSIVIGNDVWIGHGVTIMDGIRIGDGAIVATNALVTKDVLPYTIVGGVPAKLIKERFDTKFIEFLIQFKWWEKDLNWIKVNAEKFVNIENFYLNFKDE